MRINRICIMAPALALVGLYALAAGPAAAQFSSVTFPPLGETGLPTPGGQAPAAALSLSDVIARSLEASTALKIANRNLDADAARVAQAKDSSGPKVNATANGLAYNTDTVVDFGGKSILVSPQYMGIFNIEASLPIDLTGQIKAQTDQYRLQALSDRFNRDSVANSRVLSAETDYFGVLRAQHQVEVSQASLTDAQTQQNVAQKEYNAGTGQRVDLLRANTQVANAQQNLLSAQNALSIARINLNDNAGLPLDSPTNVQDVQGVTTGVTAQSLTAASQAQATTPTYFAAPTSDFESIDISQSVQNALKARPELRADLVNIQAASKSIKLARAGMEPSFSITALGTYYNQTSFQFLHQEVGELDATLTVPIFDDGVTREKVRQARDVVGNAQDTYAGHQADVESQVRTAYLNLETAAQQIDSANVALQQAVAARQLAETRYESGVALYLEVTDAEAAQSSAETGQVNAVYGYLVAKAQFENAIGAPNLNPTLPSKLITLPSVLPAAPPELPSLGGPVAPQGGTGTVTPVPVAPSAL